MNVERLGIPSFKSLECFGFDRCGRESLFASENRNLIFPARVEFFCFIRERSLVEIHVEHTPAEITIDQIFLIIRTRRHLGLDVSRQNIQEVNIAVRRCNGNRCSCLCDCCSCDFECIGGFGCSLRCKSFCGRLRRRVSVGIDTYCDGPILGSRFESSGRICIVAVRSNGFDRLLAGHLLLLHHHYLDEILQVIVKTVFLGFQPIGVGDDITEITFCFVARRNRDFSCRRSNVTY